MSGPGIKWSKAKPGKLNQLAGTRFPKDALGQKAKEAFIVWKAGLTRKEKEKLYSVPR